MLIRTCMAKIHRATVTEADLDYIGSITIDEELLDKSGIKPFQYVNITNLANGFFWQTYVIAGPRGNGDICLNGPPAHHFHPGDKIIILAEAWIEPGELKNLDPIVVFVDDKNSITEVRKHKAIPVVVKWFKEQDQAYTQTKVKTGLAILYSPREDGTVAVNAVSEDKMLVAEAIFPEDRIDEAHILYMEATELLNSRAKLSEDPADIRKAVETLFALFRGEKKLTATAAMPRAASGNFVANPGKQLAIDVDDAAYLRLPVRTRLITTNDTNLMPLLEEYVGPYLQPDDIIFVSEKALTVTQGRIVDMSEIKPTRLARLLARNVGTYYGSNRFHGFGHGTSIAMQLFLEEAGYLRVFFAAVVAAITRPFGIHGMFYRICGKSAKSIDCPMSFLILEYAHSAKLAPHDPNDVARQIKKRFGNEAVILDANYRGAFSLGKSTRAISESFIGELFRDNPLGQSDEMTPFCIVRKAKN